MQTQSAPPSREITEPAGGRQTPFGLRRLEEFLAVAYLASLPVSMTLSWILLIAGAVIWAAQVLVRHSGDSPAITRAPLAWPLAALALAVAISGAFNSGAAPGQLGPNAAPEALASLATLKNLLPYFWSYRVFSRNPGLKLPALTLLLSISAVAGYWGTIQQIFDIHPGYKYLQATGFLGGPMSFAGQMQIFSMLSLGLVAGGGWALPRGSRLAWLCAPASLALILAGNFLGLLFAGERSAWLGGFAGILVLSALISRKAAIRACIVLSLAALLVWQCVPLVKTRIDTMLSGKDVGITARLEIWDECLSLYPKSPLVGVGIRNFPHFAIEEAIIPGVSKDLNHAHSNYLHMLTTTGLLGLAAFLAVLAAIAARGVRQLHLALQTDNRLARGIMLGLLAATFALSVSGLFEYNFGTSQVRMAHWALLGLL